jgi:hypothetical protein
MKKRLPKLTLSLESLRVLDGPRLAGMALTDAQTCAPSCAPTCGNPGVAPPGFGVGVQAPGSRACCV